MKGANMAKRTDSPLEPVISASECYAALRLMGIMCDNIVASGDVSEEIVQFADELRQRIDGMKVVPNDKDKYALGALIRTGFVPGFPRSPERTAGAGLLNLITARGTQESERTLRR